MESYSYFDGRGAPTRSAVQTPDGWSISALGYDAIGRAVKNYNPFYAVTPTDAVPASVKYTEVVSFDALGRTKQVQLQDGTSVYSYPNEAAVTFTDGDNQSRTGTVSRVKDQADKERRQITDALGRVVRVDEPTTSGLGGTTAPNQPTFYNYDGNDNLAKVIQIEGSVRQERKFKYDSLSRLTHEKQIEANATLNDAGGYVGVASGTWTKVLKYDSHGLLTDGYDARGVNTHFVYDSVNRVSSITFSDGTPTVTYTYDQARTNYFNKRALTRVETAAGGTSRPDTPSTATEFDYDVMGRVAAQRQSIDTQTYNLGYTYNLAGQLTSETYPSGKVITTNYDTGGRLSNIKNGTRFFLNSVGYLGKGNNVNGLTLGNQTGQGFAYNDRLQLETQNLTKPGIIIQQYDYGYGQIDANGNLDTTKNNGQLGKVESYIGSNKQWTQKFSYDSVGRLSEASEFRGDTNALSYKQKFDYDRFGNLYRKNSSNPTSGQSTPLPYTTIEDADISKTTNRFTTNTTYDDAGNVTTDSKFRDMNFWYDANGRMFKTTSTASSNQSNAVYDASGNRVAQQIDGVWQFYIYDVGGKKVAEYGGQQAQDEGGIRYIFTDWQGSTRAITGEGGVVQARMDYTAFGEEINANVGMRTTVQGFSAPNKLDEKYAQTERDKATGLDHTWFRKLENQGGRWTSPDPYNGSMSLGNPQSFNRYSYVNNQPTNFVDPSGLFMLAPRPEISWAYWRYLTFTIPTGGDPGGGGGGGGGGTQQQQESCNNVNVSITNNNQLTSKQLTAMQNEISRIYSQIGININFVSSNADYYLSINPVGSNYSSNPDAVGVTYLDGNRVTNNGRVFVDRLRNSASSDNAFNQNSNALAVGLGRAGSHEIGHFLLQQNLDSPRFSGVMHNGFSGSSWFSNTTRNQWKFSGLQAALIKYNLSKRCGTIENQPGNLGTSITPHN